MERNQENVFEFLNTETKAMLTLSKQRDIYRCRKLKEKYPEDVTIHTNADGTIFATVPADWIRIQPPKKIELTEEERRAKAEHLNAVRQQAIARRREILRIKSTVNAF